MGKLADFTIEELMIFSATILASLGIFMKICFTSRCKKVSVCCGFLVCDREPAPMPDPNIKPKPDTIVKEPEPEPETESIFAQT